MKKRFLFLSLLSVFIIIFTTMLLSKNSTGIHAYNIYSTNYGSCQTTTLDIVVNQFFIPDKRICAEEIIRKCRENRLQNMMFSYDLTIPDALNITVYPTKWHMEQDICAFTFSYEPKTENVTNKYNMLDHPEQFHISFIS